MTQRTDLTELPDDPDADRRAARRGAPDSPGPGAWTLLLLAVALGVLTALVETAVVELLPPELGSFKYRPSRMALAVSLGVVPAFLVWGLVVVLASRVAPRVVRPRIALALLAFPFFLDAVLLAIPRIELYAAALLASGLAIALGRILEKRCSVLRPARVTASIAVASTVLVLLPLDSNGDDVAVAHDADGGARPRNLIVVTLDVLRAASTGLHGYARNTTPQLERFARRGVTFENAYATSSWTLPSHASIFTGLPAEACGTGWVTPLDGRASTLAEVLRGRGYETAGFVANLEYCTARTGLARGFAHYEDHVLGKRTVLMSTALGRRLDELASNVLGRRRTVYPDRKNAQRITDDCLAWLDSRTGERPFFAFLNYFDVHEPFETPAPHARHFDHRAEGLPRPSHVAVPDEELDRLRGIQDRYDSATRFMDLHLARLLDGLEERGLLSESVVVVTSDHGEVFYEHRARGHSNSLHVTTLHVPLVVVAPDRVPEGRRVAAEVSLRDLGRTCLELLFPGHDAAGSFPGTPWPLNAEAGQVSSGPLRAHLQKGLRVAPGLPNSEGDVRSVLQDGLHLVVHEDPRFGEELYDLADDPMEQRNLVEDPAYGERLETLRALVRGTDVERE